MVSAINPNRIVPVQEDLVLPYNQLEIIRGWEKMHRMDKPLASGVVAKEGEWLVLGDNGKLVRPSATGVQNTFLVIAGTDRFDVAATQQATLVVSSKIVARTAMYNSAATYAVGDALTVKDLGAGEAVVTPAAGSDAVLAYVFGLGNGFIEFATV